MKKINLKRGVFVYELGEQKMYETLAEVLADYPNANITHVKHALGQPNALGVVRAELFSNDTPVFMQIQKPADEFEILED